MRKGTRLAAGDITVAYDLENGQHLLRVCRPPHRRLATEKVRAMQLVFDASGLCPRGKESRKSSKAKHGRRIILFEVPVKKNIPDKEAEARGQLIVSTCFRLFVAEDTRTLTAKHEGPSSTPYRVYGPARAFGAVGVPARNT